MNIKTILTTVVLCGFLLTSCADNFLDVQPENAVTPANFFQSESDFRQAVNGIYAPLQILYDDPNNAASGLWLIAEMRSDNTHYIFNTDNRGFVADEHIADFLVESNNGDVANVWTQSFLIISRANEVIAQLENAEFDQASIDNLEGQARFLRAFAYFHLVRLFGDVPMPLDPSKGIDETSLPSTPPGDVLQQVISDAESAAQLLPDKSQQETGRVTSGAAYTLLGDVHMWNGDYGDAEAALNNVTNYSLLQNFADIYMPSNEGNDEMIFEVEYLGGTSQTVFSIFPYRFLPIISDPSVITGVSPASFTGIVGWNIPTDNLLSLYSSSDERLDASVNFYTGPSALSAPSTFTNVPYIKKYQHDHAVFLETDQNWPVYRYAEVLLLLAEAINEQGSRLTEAQGYLNQVRDRAGLNDTTATGQAELRDIILEERRRELAFENKRWFTLVRTGRAVDVMSAYGEELKSDPDNSYLLDASYNVNENKTVMPIPLRELQLNDQLIQNEGY